MLAIELRALIIRVRYHNYSVIARCLNSLHTLFYTLRRVGEVPLYNIGLHVHKHAEMCLHFVYNIALYHIITHNIIIKHLRVFVVFLLAKIKKLEKTSFSKKNKKTKKTFFTSMSIS